MFLIIVISKGLREGTDFVDVDIPTMVNQVKSFVPVCLNNFLSINYFTSEIYFSNIYLFVYNLKSNIYNIRNPIILTK
jgi:hypothetical protein